MKCPCTSGDPYESCCEPYHKGLYAENALKLMRSRFSAFALNHPDYIVETTHPSSPQYSENKFSWKRSIVKFSRSYSFDNLSILDFREAGDVGTVTFVARLSSEEVFTERSLFEKYKGRWLYRMGHVQGGEAPELVLPTFDVLPVMYLGEPVLREKAKDVQNIDKKFIEQMVATMDAYSGIGLAAPQVNRSERIFVTRAPVENSQGDYEKGKLKIFINPVPLNFSEETVEFSEGCLSIPGVRSQVIRPKELTMEYTDIEGARKKESFSGWTSRVIQHEYDHIEGILFIDRLS